MATKKKRGKRHPGVVLMKPAAATESGGRIGWRARYIDPDSGKVKKVSLDPSLTTAEQREDWAVDKSRTIAKRRVELDRGAPRATGTTLVDAIKRYYADNVRLSERSKLDYKAATGKLEAWAELNRVPTADDLTKAKLMAFRASVINEPKRAVVTGDKRGKRQATAQLRAPETVNGELRKVRTVLGYLRKVDLLPRLSNDDLRDCLQRIAVVTERVEYLKPHECQQLLEAALRHDAETYKETRDEHAGPGRQRIGSTARYSPIAPFTAHVLLTGMRFSEALGIEWSDVALDALDNDGAKVGEIHLEGAKVKTKRARTVDLAVSPALRNLLAALKLRGGKGSVFGLTEGEAEAAAKRLREDYGAPKQFTWQMLRRTCGTFLTNAPGIFGSASAFRSAAQLGHSVRVAERHYLGVARGIPRDARTVEAAMQVEQQVAAVAAAVGHASATAQRRHGQIALAIPPAPTESERGAPSASQA
jgi:integrase